MHTRIDICDFPLNPVGDTPERAVDELRDKWETHQLFNPLLPGIIFSNMENKRMLMQSMRPADVK